MIQSTEELVETIRGLSQDLRPSALDDLGLLPALVHLIEHFESRTGLRVAFCQEGLEAHRLPPAVETTAFRIVQEALTNIVRHAGVDEAEVGVWVDERRLRICVRDEGRGFDRDRVIQSRAGVGLLGMKERAEFHGGRLRIETRPREGTRITAEMPLEDAEVTD